MVEEDKLWPPVMPEGDKGVVCFELNFWLKSSFRVGWIFWQSFGASVAFVLIRFVFPHSPREIEVNCTNELYVTDVYNLMGVIQGSTHPGMCLSYLSES